VLGPGGVGGFVAAALARAGARVEVVAGESTAALVASDGIHVESARLGTFAARPSASPVLDEPVDVLLVTTKATTLESALERVKSDPDLVVPLLNGLEHMDLLRSRFRDRVAAGAIRIEAERPSPGHISQTSPFLLVELASSNPSHRSRLEALASELEAAQIPARVLESEATVLWHKLVRLNALALTTSAARQQLGFIRSDPGWRATLEACISEAATVASADGAPIEPETVIAELDEAHANLGSSMQRDIEAGREPELDAIAGAVLRAAARHGLRCPTIEHLRSRLASGASMPSRVAASR
jgi:2-dehydropantoate 2-reductase